MKKFKFAGSAGGLPGGGRRFWRLGWLILLTVSCVSGPQPQHKPSDLTEREADFALLAPEGLVYFYVDVQAARPILDSVERISGIGIRNEEILDRTRSAVGAVYRPGAPRRFLVAGRGLYPGFSSWLTFFFSPSWERYRSAAGSQYWRSRDSRLSVSLDSGLALVSDGDPFTPPPGAQSPGGFWELSQGAVLAGWLDNTDSSVQQVLGLKELPLQIPADRVIFGVYPSESSAVETGSGKGNRYELAFQIEMPSVNQARALMSILSLGRIAVEDHFSGGGEDRAVALLFFSNTPVLEGSSLRIRSDPMDEKEIALLFNTFSLYF